MVLCPSSPRRRTWVSPPGCRAVLSDVISRLERIAKRHYDALEHKLNNSKSEEARIGNYYCVRQAAEDGGLYGLIFYLELLLGISADKVNHRALVIHDLEDGLEDEGEELLDADFF